MDVNMSQDSFDFNPTNTPDAGGSVLPTPGEYIVRATSVGKRKDGKTGQIKLDTNSQGEEVYPTHVINRLEIVEPVDDSITVSIFADVRTKPFVRGNAPMSSAVDALKAIDPQLLLEIGTGEEAFKNASDVLERELTSGSTFRVRLGYQAKDMAAIKAELDSLPEGSDTRDVWKKHTYYTKAFKNGNGYNTAIQTEAGNLLEAKLVIDNFVPASKGGKLGPFVK